jgi:hypothetical protein
MRHIFVSGLGTVGLTLVLLGAVLVGVGLLSTPDAWGFNRAVAVFGLMMLILGGLLYAAARTKTKQKP